MRFSLFLIFLFLIQFLFAQKIKFNDPDIELSLIKPKGWNIHTEGTFFLLTPGHLLESPSIRFKYMIVEERPSGNESYFDFLFKHYLPANRENFKMIEVDSDSLNNKPLYSYSYSHTIGGETEITKVYTFWDVGRRFELELSSIPSDFRSNKDVLLSILESIEYKWK